MITPLARSCTACCRAASILPGLPPDSVTGVTACAAAGPTVAAPSPSDRVSATAASASASASSAALQARSVQPRPAAGAVAAEPRHGGSAAPTAATSSASASLCPMPEGVAGAEGTEGGVGVRPGGVAAGWLHLQLSHRNSAEPSIQISISALVRAVEVAGVAAEERAARGEGGPPLDAPSDAGAGGDTESGTEGCTDGGTDRAALRLTADGGDGNTDGETAPAGTTRTRDPPHSPNHPPPCLRGGGFEGGDLDSGGAAPVTAPRPASARGPGPARVIPTVPVPTVPAKLD